MVHDSKADSDSVPCAVSRHRRIAVAYVVFEHYLAYVHHPVLGETHDYRNYNL